MYDYIIVGGGSGGCVLADRLSADGSAKVCLIEYGGDDNKLLINMPVGVAAILPTPIHNYAYQTVPQAGLNGRRGYQPRGRVLGGSSSINAMCYIRGQAEDYDTWAANGASGWSYDDVLPVFKVSENNERGGDAFHGVGGPLNVADPRTPNPVSEMFVQAAIDRQHRANDDFNGARQDGVGLYQLHQKNGRRWSVARAYLDPARPRSNLTVLTDAKALHVILKGSRVTGVAVSQKGNVKVLEATTGVISCAGAFGSPQLLMLSGIGPESELTRHGLRVRVKSTGVGRNLQDHPDHITLHRSSSPDVFAIGAAGGTRMAASIPRYRREGSGPLTSNFAEGGAFLSTGGPEGRPDVQLHFVVGMVDDHSRRIHLGAGYSCHVCVLRPESRGSVTLATADPFSAPVIDPNFLAAEQDVKTLLAGFRLVRDIMQAPALKSVRGKELHTEGLTSDADLIHSIRSRTDTVYHPVGTCRMGDDADAVCDSRLKVRGIDNLWVADASVMPTVLSGNTNAAVVMIAERAARFIAG